MYGTGFLTFLSTLSALQPYVLLPWAAIGLAVLFCLLGRKRIAAYLGPVVTDFVRGLLVAAMALSALLATANYTNLGAMTFGNYLNAYEFYHYYLGSKYARELGYTGLYAASLVADDETGMKFSDPKKMIRNLDTGGYISAEKVLQDRNRYKSRFSVERWQEWVKDIQWFKGRLVTGRWNGVLRDKGYNASPVWSTVVGGLLTNRVSTDNAFGMALLSYVDLILLSIAFGCVCWAFGLRAALFMVVLIGTHYMMHFSHMKGALVRTDFAVCLVLAVCLLKKEYYVPAGAFAAYAFLSRLFPLMFVFGLAAKIGWDLFPTIPKAVRRLNERGARAWVIAGGAPLVAGLLGGAVFLTLRIYAPIPESVWGQFPLIDKVPVYVYALAIIPAVTFGLACAAITVWGWAKGYMDRRYLRFFAAFGLTVAVFISASFAYSAAGARTVPGRHGCFYLWEDFSTKIGRHNRDISPWRVGFKYIFIGVLPGWSNEPVPAPKPADPAAGKIAPEPPRGAASFCQYVFIKPLVEQGARLAGFDGNAVMSIKNTRDAFKPFEARIKSAIYRDHPALWWGIMAVALGLCFLAVRRLDDHLTFAFGFVPFFFMISPTYYYYILLTAPLLFFTTELERPSRLIGVILMFLSAMAGHQLYSVWQQEFPTYYWLSWLNLLLALYMILLAFLESYGFSRKPKATEPAIAAPAVEPMEPAEPAETVATTATAEIFESVEPVESTDVVPQS
jgi:hypothetical protein